MSIYWRDGSAILECPVCGFQKLIHWKAGDPPYYIEEHCGETLRQITHNDGLTPLSKPCTSYCCPQRTQQIIYFPAPTKPDATQPRLIPTPIRE